MTKYLILHKVRGEPAFDIAEKACVDNPPCQPNCGCWNEIERRCLMANEWVIPTSGHRAYPYWHTPLGELIQEDMAVPIDWPDHYEVKGSPPPPNFNIMEAISGLLPKIKRRV